MLLVRGETNIHFLRPRLGGCTSEEITGYCTTAASESFQHNEAFICSPRCKNGCALRSHAGGPISPRHDGTYERHIKMIICGGGSPSRRRRWAVKCFFLCSGSH